MTTGVATITLLTAEQILSRLQGALPGLKGMEVRWGLPFINSEGEMCLEIAFGDEASDPAEWGVKPLAVRQYEYREKMERLLLAENLDEIGKIAALAR